MKQNLPVIFLFTLVLLVLGATLPANCQTVRTTKGQQKRELRSSIKEAQLLETDFNESHLNVSAYNLKKGESGRKLKKVKKKDEMPINEDGTAAIKPKTLPKKSALARSKKK